MHNKPTTSETNVIRSIFNKELNEQIALSNNKKTNTSPTGIPGYRGPDYKEDDTAPDLNLGGVAAPTQVDPNPTGIPGYRGPDYKETKTTAPVSQATTETNKRTPILPGSKSEINKQLGNSSDAMKSVMNMIKDITTGTVAKPEKKSSEEVPEPMFPEDKPLPVSVPSASKTPEKGPEPIFPENKSVSTTPQTIAKPTQPQTEKRKGGYATMVDPNTGRTDTSRHMMPPNTSYVQWSSKESAIPTTVVGSKQDPIYVAQQEAKAEAARNPAKNVSQQIQTALKLTKNDVRLANQLTDAAVEAGVDLEKAQKEQLDSLMADAKGRAAKIEQEMQARRAARVAKTSQPQSAPTPPKNIPSSTGASGAVVGGGQGPGVLPSLGEAYYQILSNKLNEEKAEPSGAQVNQAAYGFDPRGGRNARKALASLKSGMWRGDSTSSGKIKSETKPSPIDSQFQPSWGEKLKPHVITLMSAAQEHKIELSKEEAVNPGSKDHQRLLSMYPKDHDIHKASQAVGEIMRSRSNA